MPILEVKNDFVKHTLFWWTLLPLFAVIVLPYFLPIESFTVSNDEIKCFRDFGRSIDAVTTTTDGIFNAMFVETGVVKVFQTMFIHHGQNIELSRLNGMVANFTQHWNNGFWMMTYRAMWRLVALWPLYLGIIFSMVAPSFIDGLVQRSIKSFDYKFHNPVYFFSSLHLMVLVLGLAVFIPLLPFHLTAPLLGAFGVLMSITVWITTANFQTGG